jgi:RHS repeat-associated protein
VPVSARHIGQPESYYHGEGRVALTGSEPAFQYKLTDHLGNTMVLFEDKDGDGIITTESNPAENEVLQRNFYYAFGLPMQGPWNHTSTDPDMPYLYNGKELEGELGLGWYAYGFRYYDASVGRFVGVDPKAADAPGWTPYRAFFNNPLRYIDPDGLFEIETGKIEKGDNLTAIAKQLNEKFKTNLTVDQIAKANNIKDVNKIKAGDFITLPGTDVELNFDLNSLKVSDANYNVDMPGLEWKGTSGREGYQNPESQNLKDKGPIPEGQYLVDPARTQSISDISSWDRFKGNFGGGTWPGLENSWGEHRTWLTPSTTTNTFGRSGFTIHGGAVPGSAGCIDLTSKNNSFHSWLKSHNKPLILNVKY